MRILPALHERWPLIADTPPANAWLSMRSDLGLARHTIDAYGRGLSDYLRFCAGSAVDPVTAGMDHVARFVRTLLEPTLPVVELGAVSILPQARWPMTMQATSRATSAPSKC